MLLPERETEQEFADLLNRSDSLNAADLRRLAQLWELFQDFEQAEACWRRAVEAGDVAALCRTQTVVPLPVITPSRVPLAALPLTG